jgi:hypothetical protein
MGVARLWELPESSDDGEYELDLELFAPIYTGSEGMWFDASETWMVFASHEGSVTISGAELIRAFERVFPEATDWRYSPF